MTKLTTKGKITKKQTQVTVWHTNLNHDWCKVSDIVTIKFKHIRHSLVETETILSFAGRFLQQLSLRQFAFWAFDGDVNLNSRQLVQVRPVRELSAQNFNNKTFEENWRYSILHHSQLLPQNSVHAWELVN